MTPRAVALVLACALCAWRSPSPLAADSDWKDAAPGRRISLPADHRSHPDYRLEWWYYTGNLFAEGGRRFGYQLTFFRVGVNAVPPTPSRWAMRDLHMAHLTVTDVSSSSHVAAERLNRDGVGWAGASDTAYSVWNDDWSVTLDGRRHHLVASAPDRGIGIDLRLLDRPPALHGLGGFSQKGSSPGNASYYYSLTRMPTDGTIRAGGRAFAVTGASWMDHEFGTTFLEPHQAGWDWFSLQLGDGRDLMVFQLRGRDGSIDPRSSGTLVAAGGRARALDAAGIRLEPLRRWTSAATGAAYPVEWRVELPDERLALRVRAAVDAQELHDLPSGLTYWEGAIDVEGTANGAPVSGVGYLEMTGYGGTPLGHLMARPPGLMQKP